VLDAPSDVKGFLRAGRAGSGVSVQPVDAASVPVAGLYGVRGPGPSRNCALEAELTFLVFRASGLVDRCAIRLV
jgi:hypothetical protein